jgi:hypothetical protein
MDEKKIFDLAKKLAANLAINYVKAQLPPDFKKMFEQEQQTKYQFSKDRNSHIEEAEEIK